MPKSSLVGTTRIELGINKITIVNGALSRTQTVFHHPPKNSIADITINWGRQSFFEAPRKRTATVRLLPSPEWSIRRMLLELPMQTLRVIMDGLTDDSTGEGNNIVFEGNIDSLQISEQAGNQIMELSCTETFGQSSTVPDLDKEIPWPSTERLGLSDVYNRVRTVDQSIASIVRQTWEPSYYFRPHGLNTGYVTLQQAMESLAAWYPAGHPSWSPDHKILRSTWSGSINTLTFSPLRYVATIINGNVVSDTGDIHTDVRDWPRRWAFMQRGTRIATSNEQVFQRYNWERGITEITSDKNIALDLTSLTDFNGRIFTPTIAAIKSQVTSARRFQLRNKWVPDTLRFLWQPWETSQWKIRIPDDPVAKWLGIQPDFVIIGGTLKITDDDVIHDIACLWTNEWKPSDPKPSWETMINIWGTYTDEWSKHQ